MKNAVFWEVTPCGSCILRSVLRLLVYATTVHSSSIPVTLKMEAIRSSEKSVLTRAIRRNIPEDDIFQILRTDICKREAHVFSHVVFLRKMEQLHPFAVYKGAAGNLLAYLGVQLLWGPHPIGLAA
jgi:hypothetical protein